MNRMTKEDFTTAELSYVLVDLAGNEIVWIYTTDRGVAVPYYLEGKPAPELSFGPANDPAMLL